MTTRICLVLFALACVGCGSPKLDLESEDAFRASVREMRASLKTDKEREVLAEALELIRANRSSEHRALMDVPTLTPAQEKQLEELEFQHEMRVYEELHGASIDGVARALQRLFIEHSEDFTAEIEEELERLREVEKISVRVSELPPYRHGGRFMGRSIGVVVENGSRLTIPRDGNGSAKCSCTDSACSDELKPLDIHVLRFEDGLEPGESEELQQLDLAEPGEERFTGVEPEALDCWLTQLDVEADRIGLEVANLYFFDGVKARIQQREERLLENQQRLEHLRGADFDFGDVVEEFAEAERRLQEWEEEQKLRKESGDD